MIDANVQAGDGSISNDENVIIHNLGTLNWNIYDCISEKHVSDEVIITDEQLSHIQGKHPEAYEDAIHYVKDVLESPDYIIWDKHPNTGLVIKKYLAILAICCWFLELVQRMIKRGIKILRLQAGK